jgi:hypothetical protein
MALTTCPSPVQEEKLRPRAAYCIDPLQDPRWDRFLQRHRDASLFHSSFWLKTLQKTYGYEPIAYTTSAPNQELENAVVFCAVKSWLTGRRLVSLPFSDHCQPLIESREDVDLVSGALEEDFRREKWDYIEVRPLQYREFKTSLRPTTVNYSFHRLDLSPDLDVLYRNFHKSSIERKIRRAEREQLIYCEGHTQEFLEYFYRLFTMTRKRHRLPPPPKAWFANLLESFGEAIKIRVAFKNDRPIAAMMTIAYKDTLTYKYGCCDSTFNPLGCMHLLYWKAIQDAKVSGLSFLDLGRTDAEQHGLVTFKSRWGAVRSDLTYTRYGNSGSSTHIFDLSTKKWKAGAAKWVMFHLPAALVSKIGQFLYGHVG